MSLPRDLLKNWTILVVDDEADSLDVARQILQFYGANVMTALNGEDGILLARQQQPRFIISDLSMPIMDGWKMIDLLKKERATADIPVIALTAHAMPGDRQKAIAAGFTNYLTKPLTVSNFMNDLLALLVEIPAIAAQLKTE